MTEFSSFVFDGDAVRAKLDLRVYRLLAVKKAAYRFADRFTAVFGAPDGDTLPIVFKLKAGTGESAATQLVHAFFQELLDQELREQIGEEIGPMRTLILAQASSKTGLIRRE